jgi:predicted deacylase
MAARAPKPHPVTLPRPDIARWREGNAGVPFVHALDSGNPGPEVLVTALVHGNEYAGAVVLGELLAAGLKPSLGRLTLAFCNVQAFGRFDPREPDASRFVDEDLNRVWTLQRLEGPADSSELRRARELRPFVDRATHLLDLHSMHEPGAPLLITGTLPRNIEFAGRLRCGGQIVIDEGHADGVRMRDYEGRGYPGSARISLLLEAGQHWDPASVGAARDVLMRFLVEADALTPSQALPGWLAENGGAAPAVRVTHRVVARSLAFRFVDDFRGGEVIPAAGTVIATDGDEPVRTPYDGCVLVMPSVRQLRPGVTTVRLGHAVEARAG